MQHAICVGGACCSTLCGPCQGCDGGTCYLAPAGTDPESSCASSACSGSCDGDGGCAFPADAGCPAPIPCDAGSDCPASNVACAGMCLSNQCVYPSSFCGHCDSCSQGACLPNLAGTDPHSECGGIDPACSGSCNGDGGCGFPARACVTGKPCTSGDHCSGGICTAGSPVPGCCTSAADCPSFDSSCTATCDAGQCLYPTDECSPCHLCYGGFCVESDNLACDAGNACLSGQHCSAGLCAGTPITPCCQADSDCPAPANICLHAACINNLCATQHIGGCCLTTADCAAPAGEVAVCESNQCIFYLNLPDGGPVDAGPIDAGEPSQPDAGPLDAGSFRPDSGQPQVDAGAPDAGPADAGSTPSAVDAGRPGSSPKSKGCGCQSPGDVAVWWPLLPFLLGIPRRRREARLRA